MRGSYRKQDRRSSRVRRPAYRVGLAPAESCRSAPAMRIELPRGEPTGDL